MKATRKIPPKTAPRIGPRRVEELEVGLELELELGAVEVDDPVYPADPDEDGIVTFVTYI